jgi:uncharacterized membrane protein YcaP (DUF421 family)
VTKNDLRSKLRDAIVLQLSQIRAVVVEATGTIVVLFTKNDDIESGDWFLKKVKKS